MDVKVIQIEYDILIGGFSVKSNGETFNEDIQSSYNDFIQSGKIESLNNIAKNTHEYIMPLHGMVMISKVNMHYYWGKR